MSSQPRHTIHERLLTIAPGIRTLLSYRRSDLRHDVMAGLSVAAVAIPVGVAYAELVGVEPVVGLYASIFPLVAYALFGTSRQLIVGPDAATCAIVAAAVAPLAGGNQDLYYSFSITKEGIIPRLTEFISKLGLTHPPTLSVGLVAFVVLVVSPRLIPRLPAA